MYRTMYQWITNLGIFSIMGYTLFNPEVCIKGATSGLLLWFNKLLPSLLPFIILTKLIFELGTIFEMEKYVGKVSRKIFGVSGNSLLAFMLGSIGGYPTGGVLTEQLLAKDQISLIEAQKTLCFSNNCSLLFIIATVGTILLNDIKLGYFLVIVHVLSSFTMLILSRFYKDYELKTPGRTTKAPYKSFVVALTTAVQKGMDSIVYVGGYIIFFSMILHIVKDLSIFNPLVISLAKLFNTDVLLIESLILGSLEFSNGTAYISQYVSNGTTYLGILSALIAFGGICVFFQTAQLLVNTKLSLNLYLTAKIIQATFAYLYTMLLFPIYQAYNVGASIQIDFSILSLVVGLFAVVATGLKFAENISAPILAKS
ncbi:hypothetical protein AN639_07005 [Candidatus Epulonipiscium fishelsonii]|uniref:Uncharacterized protein n=1 Tax=Candidatus Epulonipiscium fishelsonii TaxID=77094 RepID=A0ACC8XGG4_9FIRM|nr:hypothetical protein AN639_07005 [Epulopiscium sp. SCG-B05WGA-EpuloA1]ONI42755.1 hypothetical protein AN396_13220 [Epulopiscium sp. SCG-B11WGA-EpuloA1]